MTAKAWASAQKPVDEVFCQTDSVSLCMLINRRARTMRVIDFRAGPSAAKRNFVLSFARREEVDKVYTLVERDEVSTWIKLGFSKEGNIPGFYKRSDAFMLGCLASAASAPRDRDGTSPALSGRGQPLDEVPTQSETRLVAARPAGSAAPMTPAQERMERTILTAKKSLKDGGDKSLPPAKVSVASAADARKAVAVAVRSGRALTAFEPFGRDVARRYFVATVRGGFELYASTETQACFGNAYLELLHGPRTDAERLATTAALGALGDVLLSESVVGCFSLAPSDDVALATAFLQNGFRRTGLLLQHLLVAGQRKDAILWSRKLSNPTDD